MNILFGSHKGGVGKSTLLASIAVALSKHFSKRVAILETDKLRGLKKWHARRCNAGLIPEITYMENYTDIKKATIRLHSTHDYVLIDSAGHDSKEFRQAMTFADVLLSPLCPSSQVEIDSLEELTVTVKQGQAAYNPKLHVFIVLNRCSTHSCDKDTNSIYQMLNNDPDWLPAAKQHIYERSTHRRTFSEGKGIHEGSDSKAKSELERLMIEIGIM
ncbi:ParA family protein (plasmid) [Candidatus Fukatsuia symbiotica]|uniref:Peptidyl-arginine deiminase n=1 Tax=Candidatus Fukatsuia symbiotica TaxID=1878942 RepID=A0A2Y9CKI2_9GAMM|nr:ParA family protein [Candidatus Fukatsuia symbiotica]AWK15560.1 hypothetical protein CCS41_14140 [Candidatus Fukatsuia symbiotica]MEA9445825.1 ParA family protein [Candidatus Fukatsuia symbiotica]